MLKTMFLLSTRRGKNIHPVQTGTEGYLSNTTGEVQKVFLFSFFAKTECSLNECTLFSALGHDGTTSTFSLVFFSIFGGTFLSSFFFFALHLFTFHNPAFGIITRKSPSAALTAAMTTSRGVVCVNGSISVIV